MKQKDDFENVPPVQFDGPGSFEYETARLWETLRKKYPSIGEDTESLVEMLDKYFKKRRARRRAGRKPRPRG
jgi:hypothetical protein